MDLLFKWANEPLVRQNSFNTALIKYEDHQKWFNSKLNSDDCFLYILTVNNIPVGQIRIEVEGDIGIINYSISNEHRKKGYGTSLLKMIIDRIKEDGINIGKLVGRVKHTNLASVKTFLDADYDCLEKEEFLEFYKSI